jgi:hypothetical protein
MRRRIHACHMRRRIPETGSPKPSAACSAMTPLEAQTIVGPEESEGP